MADKKKPTILPWGMNKDTLQPNSVKGISQSKIKAFNVGRMNPLKKSSQFQKKKEDGDKKKMLEAQQTAEVFEEFVASFQDSGSSGKAFVRGSSSVKAAATGSELMPNPSGGSVYKPKSRFHPKPAEDKTPKEEEKSIFPSNVKKPPKKKGAEKKKSILELFREELKRSQDGRKERRAHREATLRSSPEPPPSAPLFDVEEYTEMANKGSFDNGDPLTTNLYVGNINPKMNEDNLCQLFGKFGPLASVKVMWPRTEEEKARNKNCGFVAYMKRQDADNALDHFKGTKIMDYEIQIGWGKAVRVPPQPIYVPPDKQEEENAKIPDPPSGLPFNAQAVIPVVKVVSEGKAGFAANDPEAEDHPVDDVYGDLYNAIVRVVIPTDVELLKVVHRMIEFVIREGPMFEAMIMNRELNNPTYQFLFDNRSPAHIYYRWKLFSILQGDSPETWRIEEFHMFEAGSLWKPPPLKCLRSKVLPPVDDQIARRGQLSTRQRDELEHMLRHITMERDTIKTAMVWCLDHADSAEEISECMCEALSITETPLPTKVARLYLVSDILVNCSSNFLDSMNFRREFEGKLLSIVEHFHMVMISIKSRMKKEQFKRRVLKVLLVWDNAQVYHYNVVDKMRLTFIGKTTDDMEKQKAFDTVAALIGAGTGSRVMEDKEEGVVGDSLDGVPLAGDRVLDFELGDELDGQPLDDGLDGEPMVEAGSESGTPNTSKEKESGGKDSASSGPPAVKSKWELVDYGDDSDESEEEEEPAQSAATLAALERQKLLAEVAERKRKILRDVEVKAMELYDALESSGSYNKEEINERVDKYREKLMQEAVEPKFSPPRTKKKKKARSPSPTNLDKYHLDISPPASSKKKSSSSQRESKHKGSHSKSPSKGRKRSPSPAQSPVERKLYSSRSRRSRSKSPEEKHRSKSPISPPSRISKSPISPASRRSKSWSPAQRSQSTSPPPKRHRKSQSPPSKSSGKSRSPVSGSGRSQSPLRRSRSRTPVRSSKRSRSPLPRSYRRSRSPPSGTRRSRSPRSRSRSPARSSRRSRSPVSRSRKRSRSPVSRSSRKSRSPRARSSRHSRSPVSRSRRRSRSRSRSRSPARVSKKSRSPARRSRSRSPARSSTSRRRSKSPKTSKRRSSPSSSKSSKKSKKRSKSRSPHKSKKKSKH